MLINSFLTYLRCELNRSAHTVLAYANDIEQFASHVTGGKPDEFQPETCRQADIRQWILSLSENGVSQRSIKRKRSSLSALFRYLMRTGAMTYNPAAEVPLSKTPRKLPVFVRQAEMAETIADMEQHPHAHTDFEACRDHLIVLMFYSTGMRLSELIGLKDADVDTRSGELKVLGKRNKERIIPFGAELAQAVESYRQLRRSGRPVARRDAVRAARRQAALSRAGAPAREERTDRTYTRHPNVATHAATLIRIRHAQQRSRPPQRAAASGARIIGNHTGLYTYNLPRT